MQKAEGGVLLVLEEKTGGGLKGKGCWLVGVVLGCVVPG